MKYLAIDTTTKVSGLALAEDGRLVGEGFLHTAKTHSERLVPLLDQLLRAAGWGLRDLNFIGVVRGPGSFTGIRIGIASAQGLAGVLKLPLLGVLSLDALAWAGWGRKEEIVPILDARKNEWYAARYRWLADGRLKALSPPRAVSPAVLVGELKGMDGPFVFVGDAVEKYCDFVCRELGEQAILLPDYLGLPRGAFAAQALWQKWRENPRTRGGGIPGEDEERVEPYYIRLSEAEVNWARRHGGGGDG
ncbi:1-acylglycerophosphocholine O-acyltransferase [Acididesulfobacillus acetoxydans]|uniref:1-acylglycerophosphocholine O-acyltransferase n=1 Tax=Acididesulfobacillus acetoxydans TaxID=1561005 RepID=A0A8S0XB35_9FIRM|nr:tRNA (adenosine(37)-N6)-threonylcarbamoyltransferase complex dimerization subunit type 1 TsaB [Acididesulfobacillus acetoxydans]CAA7600716.1 1-acylglycerophosphocholine O-acyltransferase [Acididesulfobacillus acetoxydans]CEJ06175.1 Universal protein YeaZ [Acididesulfobacillus acetoxydans]